MAPGLTSDIISPTQVLPRPQTQTQVQVQAQALGASGKRLGVAREQGPQYREELTEEESGDSEEEDSEEDREDEDSEDESEGESEEEESEYEEDSEYEDEDEDEGEGEEEDKDKDEGGKQEPLSVRSIFGPHEDQAENSISPLPVFPLRHSLAYGSNSYRSIPSTTYISYNISCDYYRSTRLR